MATPRNSFLKAVGPLLSIFIGSVLFLFVKGDAPVTSIESLMTVFSNDSIFQNGEVYKEAVLVLFR
jgi:hypothetical protein